jgi:acetyl-CoA acetyltransferase
MTEEQVLGAPMLSDPLTQYMFCSPGEGGVALVLCRSDLATEYTSKPVYLKSAVLRSRPFGSFEVFNSWLSPHRGDSPSVAAAKAAFDQAGIGPDEISFAQVQDTESGAEVMHLAETGICADGDQERMIQMGETSLGGRLPINTDGGCMANGEPIGASGLRQVYESVLQLQGRAGARQVADAKVGFTHVYGAPGISACTVLSV